jgi:primosomal protein N'
VTFSGEDEGAVMRGAEKFRSSLAACLQMPEYGAGECRLLGPAPCAVPKINYHFRYRISLRGKLNKAMRNLIAHMLRQFGQDRANRNIAAFVDVNGFD